MQWFKKFSKIVLFDSLAIICFIGVALFGWLPGPGGVPLFLLGLSLLAVNHSWAEKWLGTARLHGVVIKKWLFPDIEWIKEIYDSLAVFVMVLGGLLIFYSDNRIIEAIAIVVIFTSFFLFMVNRDRFNALTKKIKQFTKNKT